MSAPYINFHVVEGGFSNDVVDPLKFWLSFFVQRDVSENDGLVCPTAHHLHPVSWRRRGFLVLYSTVVVSEEPDTGL